MLDQFIKMQQKCDEVNAYRKKMRELHPILPGESNIEYLCRFSGILIRDNRPNFIEQYELFDNYSPGGIYDYQL